MGAEKTRAGRPEGVERPGMQRIYRNLLCPAKVNMILRVGPRRTDGFHDLESWMVKLRWGDRLTIQVRDSDKPSVVLDSNFKMPAGANLIERAFMGFCKEASRPLTAEIRLNKVVPTGAGLGGGSSDAATTLLALADFCGAPWTQKKGPFRRRLVKLASCLGSDIPFFLGGPWSWCEGRGEILTSLPAVQEFHVVLIFPKYAISTPWAYGALDVWRERHSVMPSWQGLPRWLLSSDWSVPQLENSFEEPIFEVYPSMHDQLRSLHKAGALAARMSGSGSTLFGLFKDAPSAKKMATIFQKRGWNAMAVTTMA